MAMPEELQSWSKTPDGEPHSRTYQGVLSFFKISLVASLFALALMAHFLT